MRESNPFETHDPQAENLGALQFQVAPTMQGEHPRLWERQWHASGIAHRPLTTRQKIWRAAGLLLTVSLMAILFGQQVAAFASRMWATAIPSPQGVTTTCLTDAAWSPSGNRLAILGYAGTCRQFGHLSPLIDLYDGAGRLRLRQIALDRLLASAEETLGRAVNTDQIALQNVIWLWGGASLAITFTLPPRSDIGETTTQFGILVIGLRGTLPASLARFYEIPNRPGSSYPAARIGVMWNLQADQAAMISGADTFNAWNNPLPLAYQYAWTSAGELSPVSSTGATDQSTQAIGNPQSDSAFSVWQSGSLTGLGDLDIAASPPDTWLAQWNTTFAAVSSDGLHILAPMLMIAPVSQRLGGPTPQPPNNIGAFPILLARDVAFSQILRVWDRYANRAVAPIIDVAWRPDGKAVATFNLHDDQKIDIFDCATGRLLTSHAEPKQSGQFHGVLSALRWSPDGKRLLTPDGAVLTL
jgi:hypothetical protein